MSTRIETGLLRSPGEGRPVDVFVSWGGIGHGGRTGDRLLNGPLRAERLNANWFVSLDDATGKVESRRRRYSVTCPRFLYQPE